MTLRPPIDAFRLGLSKLKREATKGISRVALRHATTDFAGMHLNVPLIYGLGAEYLVPDRDWSFQLLGKLLEQRPGALLDIGANVGRYLVRLRALDAEREYCGFEPNPACVLYIQELIRYNEFKNARLLPFALSNKQEIASFYIRSLGDKTGALLVHKAQELGEPYSFDVMTAPGDLVVESLGLDAISVCKIDVEGAELRVIEGLRETLDRYRPYVICEIHPPKPYDPPNVKRHELLSMLWQRAKELRYRIYSLRADGKMRALDSIDEIGSSESADHVWVPAEEPDNVMKGPFAELS